MSHTLCTIVHIFPVAPFACVPQRIFVQLSCVISGRTFLVEVEILHDLKFGVQACLPPEMVDANEKYAELSVRWFFFKLRDRNVAGMLSVHFLRETIHRAKVSAVSEKRSMSSYERYRLST